MPIIERVGVFCFFLSIPVVGYADGDVLRFGKGVRTKPAPALSKAITANDADLGLWDDHFIPADQDSIVLRKGSQFYSLAMKAGAKPEPLANIPSADRSTIVRGVVIGKRWWLFANHPKTGPLAVDAVSGDVVSFPIPGIDDVGKRAPVIQSVTPLAHAGGVFLMISGGDPKTWPRAGNHPVFFWMNLQTGKTRHLPIGWDLNFFSPDQKIAVFSTPQLKEGERRPLQGIEVATGANVATVPDRRKMACVPYTWTAKNRVAPLYGRRENEGDADFFDGLNVNGRTAIFDLKLQDTRYLSMAYANDEFAGFTLRKNGAVSGEPAPFWIVSMQAPHPVVAVADQVTSLSMLTRGNAVFAQVQPVRHATEEYRRSSEAFCFSQKDKAVWNVLDGVDRLPLLAKEFADKPFIYDQMQVRMVSSFGSREAEACVLCEFSHNRMDGRALTPFDERPKLTPQSWQRTVLVGPSGERTLVDLPRNEKRIDEIWLHSSGRVLRGAYEWSGPKGDRVRHIRISETTLELSPRDG